MKKASEFENKAVPVPVDQGDPGDEQAEPKPEKEKREYPKGDPGFGAKPPSEAVT